MTEESKLFFKSRLFAQIIEDLSTTHNLTLEKATDIFYKSETSRLIDEEVADLHCRSPKYLSALIWEEFSDKPKAEK